MKKTYIILFGAALLLGSCTRNPETDEPTPPHASSGLVIKASCTPATRTDIIEGKSTWEVGDRITVVYDGTAYVYTATEAGATTTFASDTGITAYDPSKPLTAYYPVTTVEGTVAVEPQRTITLQGTEQTNTACAPLVGTPLDKNLAEGALHVSFRNIFSVIELRIDAGELDSPAQSLAVEPASQEDFDGYLTFTGTVDPSTLALTPAPGGTGSKLTLHFPDNADLTRPQTIKFPVGRFISEAGLKLTLTTTDGRTYTKNIYKSGIRTYNEKNGIFSARHFAKALYAFASPGGIETADDLIEFAAAVNAGESLAPWQDERGFVVLLNDIDMTGIETWTPIGDAVCPLTGTNALTIESGRPFTGFFDGQGHSIRNFHMVCDNSTPNRAWGFFGALGPGAVVENLVFDASCSLAVKASKGTDCGILAGVVYDATVRNIVNNAPMSFDGSAGNVRMTMGMVGLAFASKGVVLDRLTNEAALTSEDGGNTGNGATGIHVGGICGFSTNLASSANPVIFNGCINRGDLTTKVGRASGIVAAANRYTHLTDCTNYGLNDNAFPRSGYARLGNITCITGPGIKFTNVVNRGDLISRTKGAAGGILCLVNHNDNEFIGCESYGRVISDRPDNDYKGTFFGQCKKAAKFRNCIAQGDVGTYNGGDCITTWTISAPTTPRRSTSLRRTSSIVLPETDIRKRSLHPTITYETKNHSSADSRRCSHRSSVRRTDRPVANRRPGRSDRRRTARSRIEKSVGRLTPRRLAQLARKLDSCYRIRNPHGSRHHGTGSQTDQGQRAGALPRQDDRPYDQRKRPSLRHHLRLDPPLRAPYGAQPED